MLLLGNGRLPSDDVNSPKPRSFPAFHLFFVGFGPVCSAAGARATPPSACEGKCSHCFRQSRVWPEPAGFALARRLQHVRITGLVLHRSLRCKRQPVPRARSAARFPVSLPGMRVEYRWAHFSLWLRLISISIVRPKSPPPPSTFRM